MRREAVRGLLQIGIMITLLSGCSAVLPPRDSGEFVISVCSTGVGILLLVLILVPYVVVR